MSIPLLVGKTLAARWKEVRALNFGLLSLTVLDPLLDNTLLYHFLCVGVRGRHVRGLCAGLLCGALAAGAALEGDSGLLVRAVG